MATPGPASPCVTDAGQELRGVHKYSEALRTPRGPAASSEPPRCLTWRRCTTTRFPDIWNRILEESIEHLQLRKSSFQVTDWSIAGSRKEKHAIRSFPLVRQGMTLQAEPGKLGPAVRKTIRFPLNEGTKGKWGGFEMHSFVGGLRVQGNR